MAMSFLSTPDPIKFALLFHNFLHHFVIADLLRGLRITRILAVRSGRAAPLPAPKQKKK
jgi:hypothetical protein